MSRSNLAEDMEIDILLRLPVKSLLRFRCVSKSWCTLFQNKLFITNHYLKQTSLHNTNNYANVSVLVHRQNGRIRGTFPPKPDPPYFSLLDHTLNIKENIYLPLPKDFFLSRPEIMGPCNGLMCLWNHHQITLWNPATREFKHLPESHIQRPPNVYITVFGGCGFGFDSKTDDYKVICIFDNHIQNQWSRQIDLYTLSTDSWREIEIPAEFIDLNAPKFNTCINGVFHWESLVAECIVSFNMADEVFSTVPLPFNFFSFDKNSWHVGLLNGYLAVMNYPYPLYSNMGEMRLEIWVMKEYGVKESWTKQLTIGPIVGNYCPFGLWKDGGLFLQGFDDEHLILYDPNTQEIEKLQVHSPLLTTRVVIYVESLVAINGRREHEEERFIRLPTQMGDA